MTSLISVAAIIGPITMTGIFYYFTQEGATLYFPGSPFFLAGLLMLAAWFSAYFTLRRFADVN